MGRKQDRQKPVKFCSIIWSRLTDDQVDDRAGLECR